MTFTRQVREGPAQHRQLCPELPDTRETLRASGWESRTLGCSSTAGNAQRCRPREIPPFQLRCECNSMPACSHFQGKLCSWFGKQPSILITTKYTNINTDYVTISSYMESNFLHLRLRCSELGALSWLSLQTNVSVNQFKQVLSYRQSFQPPRCTHWRLVSACVSSIKSSHW